MTRPRLVAAVVLAALSLSAVASATTMRALTVVDLADQADLVVRGHVVGVSDVMTAVDGRLEPRRIARVVADEVWVGEAPSGEIRVVERGGRDRAMVFEREGTAEFRRGQEVLLFLRRTAEGYRPVGHAQGAFVVGRERASGAARVRRSGEPGILLGSTVDKGLDVAANPRLDAVASVVRDRRGNRR